MLPSWFEMRAGTGCPLCAPRAVVSEYVYAVCTLPVSTLYLARNQAYRGTCTLVYDPAHVTRPSELDATRWLQLCSDVHAAETAITRVLRPDHINIEWMGNTVPHLHAHIVPRYRSDPRWGGPIWTTTREEMVQAPMTDAALEELARELRTHLEGGA
jgi:diadenosine tetraphosphate (Ap4A) HIT family hydrolase